MGILKNISKSLHLLKSDNFQLEKIISKGFARPSEQIHLDFLKAYDCNNRSFNPEHTNYFQRILNREKLAPEEIEFYNLPDNLKITPRWWVMPWGSVLKPPRPSESESAAKQRALRYTEKFVKLYESILKNGFRETESGPIRGYTLIHPQHGKAFNYIDGHHRIAIIQHLNNNGTLAINQIKTLSLGTASRESLTNNKHYSFGLKNGFFCESDAFLLFDHVFNRLSAPRNSNQKH